MGLCRSYIRPHRRHLFWIAIGEETSPDTLHDHSICAGDRLLALLYHKLRRHKNGSSGPPAGVHLIIRSSYISVDYTCKNEKEPPALPLDHRCFRAAHLADHCPGRELPERAGTPLTNAVIQPAPAALKCRRIATCSPACCSSARHPLSILLMQIIVVLCATRVFGFLARKIKQPAVVGEIVAGIILGPSAARWLLPCRHAGHFPGGLSRLTCSSSARSGCAFFMFIGEAWNWISSKVRQKAHDAVMISHASINIPFFLGVCLGVFHDTQHAPLHVNFLSFALFMGIAMSVTAFPRARRALCRSAELTGTQLGVHGYHLRRGRRYHCLGHPGGSSGDRKIHRVAEHAVATIGLALVFVLRYAAGGASLAAAQDEQALTDTKTKVALGFFVLLIAGYLARK